VNLRMTSSSSGREMSVRSQVVGLDARRMVALKSADLVPPTNASSSAQISGRTPADPAKQAWTV